MSQRAGSRARGFLSRGALLSLLLHVHLLAPIGVVIWIFAGRQQAAREAQRAQEMDVEFQDATAAELPKDLPPIEPPPDQVEPPKPQPRSRRPRARRSRKTSRRRRKKPSPRTSPRRRSSRSPSRSPRSRRLRRPSSCSRRTRRSSIRTARRRNEPPPDAKYLAQDNHHAAEETQARDTTLEKRKNNGKDNGSPTADKDKIAELEDQKSALGRKAPDVTPHENPQVAETQERKNEPKSLLALRDPAPRNHEITPETADPSLPKAADGDIAMSRAARGKPADPARVKAGEKVKLALAQKDFEYLFGADAEAERRLAETHRSTRKGKFAQKIARVQAALENFVPEVQPGNTTELSTRAAPFAAYIARMHRSIHKLWGFDQLEAWDELTGSSPLNDPKLATTLEAVINRDGTIDKVTIVRTSGYLGSTPPRSTSLHRRSVPRSAARDPIARRQDLRPLDVPPRRTAVHARVHAVLHPRREAAREGEERRRRPAGGAAPMWRRRGEASGRRALARLAPTAPAAPRAPGRGARAPRPPTTTGDAGRAA